MNKIINSFILEVENIGLPETIFAEVYELDNCRFFIKYDDSSLKEISIDEFNRIYNKNKICGDTNFIDNNINII
jgi:hypothetical protein